ncbi:hypothetical protein BDV30DRAFT_235281 [Aspergillus minisclerotigenes]|uniref:Uncharacterized protein n=1 Tax=Aspergillus minisclerotigenes TaxID=656917 RepID=A0A5N6JDV4_9EURO|nr:hypothetical protein BDV30DRAFT_235281 [Aspergillus minisclerotigenes]
MRLNKRSTDEISQDHEEKGTMHALLAQSKGWSVIVCTAHVLFQCLTLPTTPTTFDQNPDIGTDDNEIDVEEEHPGTYSESVAEDFVECNHRCHAMIQCVKPRIPHSHDASIWQVPCRDDCIEVIKHVAPIPDESPDRGYAEDAQGKKMVWYWTNHSDKNGPLRAAGCSEHSWPTQYA